MSVAIVCMVNNTAVYLEHQKSKMGNNLVDFDGTYNESMSGADECPAKAQSDGKSSVSNDISYY